MKRFLIGRICTQGKRPVYHHLSVGKACVCYSYNYNLRICSQLVELGVKCLSVCCKYTLPSPDYPPPQHKATILYWHDKNSANHSTIKHGRRRRGGRGGFSRPTLCAFHLTFDRSTPYHYGICTYTRAHNWYANRTKNSTDSASLSI